MKTRDDFASEREYVTWAHGWIRAYGVGWLDLYCRHNQIPLTEEELQDHLFDAEPVAQDWEGRWSISLRDVSIPASLPDLIAWVKGRKGFQDERISEIADDLKTYVKAKAAALLAEAAKTDTQEQTQEHAQFALEEGVAALVDHLWFDIGEMPADSDYFGVWIDNDHGGLWVWFTPEEVEAMCRTAYPDVFHLIDHAITTAGGGR